MPAASVRRGGGRWHSTPRKATELQQQGLVGRSVPWCRLWPKGPTVPLPPPGGIPWPATAEGQQSVACAAHSAAPGKPQRGRGAGGCGAPAIAEPSPAKRPACQPATKQLPLFCGGALRIGLLLALGTASELLSHICKIQGSTLSLLSLVNPLPCHSHQTSHEHGTTHLMRHAHDSHAMPCTTHTCEHYITHTNANTDSPFTLRHGPVLA